jgi:hypothetical protein
MTSSRPGSAATPGFQRARLIPFDLGGNQLEEKNAIPLDFNPETLSLNISTGESKARRKGNQQIQNVSRSNATLTFECIFDSTRPPDVLGGSSGSQGMGRSREPSRNLDVRRRTSKVAALIQVRGSGRDQAPRKVRFQWGQFIFDGTIKQHQEVFDYFSPDGVPLRSKVSLSIVENNFRYEVNSEEAKLRRQRVEQAKTSAKQKAAEAGEASLLSSGGTNTASSNPDLSLRTEPSQSLQPDLSAEIGLKATAGGSGELGAMIGGRGSLDLAAAVDVFGPQALAAVLKSSPILSASATLSTQPGTATAAISAAFAPTNGGRSSSEALAAGRAGGGAGVQVGGSATANLTLVNSRLASAIPQPSPGLGAPGRPSTTWAPDGPAPGSRACELATLIAAERAQGLAIPASQLLPIRGQPPLSPNTLVERPEPLFSSNEHLPGLVGRLDPADTEQRPGWERLRSHPKLPIPEPTLPFLAP